MSIEKDMFAHKKNPRKVFYDIESLHDIFTNLLITEGHIELHLVHDPVYNYISNDDLYEVLHRRSLTEEAVSFCGDKPEITIIRYDTGDEMSADKRKMVRGLYSRLVKFARCRSLWKENEPSKNYVEFYGWNSSSYDLPMLIMARMLAEKNRGSAGSNRVNPLDLKKLSNLMIEFNGKPWEIYDHLQQKSKGLFNKEKFEEYLGASVKADGHIDLAKLAKVESSDDDTAKQFPPGLKKEMARYGMDIVIDEVVSENEERTLTKEEFLNLIDYNFNDVIGTAFTSRNSQLSTFGLGVRDTIREMYPYTSATYPKSKVFKNHRLPERDITTAQLSANVVIGENRSRPEDYEAVDYKFPVAGGQEVDLLEYIKETEEKRGGYMHPFMYEFFNHFRGKDTRSSSDNWKVKRSQPITHSARMNLPYYRQDEEGNWKPVNSYIRFSSGGAHGGIWAGLADMDEEEIETWVRSDRDIKTEEKPTVDLYDVIHVDWNSFYPVMATKMQMYMTEEGVDHYKRVLDHRFAIKAQLPHRKSEWTDEHRALDRQQDGEKLVLNSLTGAGNTHKKFALVPVDNKTLSMRLIGNMNIWVMGQRFTQAGAWVFATNTDGIFLTGMTVEQAQEVIDGYIEDYDMPVEPELVDRFINRDTSTRIEYEGTERASIGGELAHGKNLHFTDRALGKNIAYPLAVGRAVLDYMDQPGWLTEPYDRQRLVDIVQDIFNQSETPEAWYHIHAGTSSRRLTVNGKRVGKINRVVLTHEGDFLGQESAREMTAPEVLHLLSQFVSGSADELRSLIENLGYELDNKLPEDWSLVPYQKNERDEKIINEDADLETIFMIMQSFVASGNESKRDDELKKFAQDQSISIPQLAIQSSRGLEPLKVWKSNKVPYTSNTGLLLNTRASLQDFDMNLLDLEPYVRWAEQILARWKVTADLPEIGMVKCDDTVLISQAKKRMTKADREIEKLAELYRNSYLLTEEME